MTGGIKQRWREFLHGRPGHRFQDRFERNRQVHASSRVVRFLKRLVAVILLVAGLVFCVIPGPGLPLLFIGAGMMADVSCQVAVLLDRLEVRVRKFICRARQRWARASATVKSAVIVLILFLGSGAVYGGYRFLMAGME